MTSIRHSDTNKPVESGNSSPSLNRRKNQSDMSFRQNDEMDSRPLTSDTSSRPMSSNIHHGRVQFSHTVRPETADEDDDEDLIVVANKPAPKQHSFSENQRKVKREDTPAYFEEGHSRNSSQEKPKKMNDERPIKPKYNEDDDRPIKPKYNDNDERPIKPKSINEDERPIKPKSINEDDRPIKPKQKPIQNSRPISQQSQDEYNNKNYKSQDTSYANSKYSSQAVSRATSQEDGLSYTSERPLTVSETQSVYSDEEMVVQRKGILKNSSVPAPRATRSAMLRKQNSMTKKKATPAPLETKKQELSNHKQASQASLREASARKKAHDYDIGEGWCGSTKLDSKEEYTRSIFIQEKYEKDTLPTSKPKPATFHLPRRKIVKPVVKPKEEGDNSEEKKPTGERKGYNRLSTTSLQSSRPASNTKRPVLVKGTENRSFRGKFSIRDNPRASANKAKTPEKKVPKRKPYVSEYSQKQLNNMPPPPPFPVYPGYGYPMGYAPPPPPQKRHPAMAMPPMMPGYGGYPMMPPPPAPQNFNAYRIPPLQKSTGYQAMNGWYPPPPPMYTDPNSYSERRRR